MAYFGLPLQQKFTSDGTTNKTLYFPKGMSKVVVSNFTQKDAANNGYGYEYIWRKGYGTSVEIHYHPAGDQTSAVDIATNAIEFVDTSTLTPGAAITVTAGTDVAQPVFTIADTSPLKDGYIVRVTNTDMTNLNGVDFSVEVINGTTFKPAAAFATAPGVAAGGSGFYRLVSPSITSYLQWAPSFRYISNITQAAAAVFTTYVNHPYEVGAKVISRIPSGFGMTELDGLIGTITAVSATTFTVDIDTSGFTAFEIPEFGATPFDRAGVTPYGDGKTSPDETIAPYKNQSYMGIVLPVGTTLPGGNNGDVIYVEATQFGQVESV